MNSPMVTDLESVRIFTRDQALLLLLIIGVISGFLVWKYWKKIKR